MGEFCKINVNFIKNRNNLNFFKMEPGQPYKIRFLDESEKIPFYPITIPIIKLIPAEMEVENDGFFVIDKVDHG